MQMILVLEKCECTQRIPFRSDGGKFQMLQHFAGTGFRFNIFSYSKGLWLWFYVVKSRPTRLSNLYIDF